MMRSPERFQDGARGAIRRGFRVPSGKRRSPRALPVVTPSAALIAAAITAMALLLGCAARVPEDIRAPAPAPLTVSVARAAPERHLGTPIRWGGRVLSVENRATTTDIEILARPLDAAGEPRPHAAPQGRFIARFQGFLDPAEYPRERLLTVSGVIMGAQMRDVGEYPYRYPLVRATGKHLWPEPVLYGPRYTDPWYGPWWGRGYGPWYRPWYW